MLLSCVIMKKVQRRKLIPAEFITVIYPGKVLYYRYDDLTSDDFHILTG